MSYGDGGGWKAVALGAVLASPWTAWHWWIEQDRVVIDNRTPVRVCYDAPQPWQQGLPQNRLTLQISEWDKAVGGFRAGSR